MVDSVNSIEQHLWLGYPNRKQWKGGVLSVNECVCARVHVLGACTYLRVCMHRSRCACALM